MPAWAVKIGVQIAQDPDKAVKGLFIGLMLIVALFGALCLPFFFLFIPAAEPEQYNDYRNAAIKITSDSGGQMIRWQEMVALDAFLLKQDFTRTSPSRIYSFFKDQYIYTTEESSDCSTTDADGNESSSTCTTTVTHTRSFEEVLSNLGLTAEEKETVKNYMLVNLDDLDDGLGPTSTGDIPLGNFTPVIHQFIWPCDVYRLTSGFGGRIDPVTGIPGAIHGGIDIGAPMGTQVRATMSGVVIFSQFTESGGNIVEIDHQNGYKTRYLHLSKLLVKVGDRVEQNAIIALSGNTGSQTTGPHLHYEIHENGIRKDPLLFYK